MDLDPDGAIQDGLWIDITGVAHLFGGEERLLEDLAAHLQRFGLTAHIGLADTFGAAFAAARFAAVGECLWSIVPPDGTRAALSTLPVDALRLPVDCVVLLQRLGLRRIGQLYDLPRETLAQRFRVGSGVTAGKRRRERARVRLAGIVLARLDQALGLAPEMLVPLEEPPAMIVRQSFIEPLISGEGVAASTAMLAAELCRRLAEAGQGGLRFSLGLYRSDGTAAHVGIGLGRPCREAAHLIGLLAEKLATLDAGFGVDVMTLAACEIEMLAGQQTALPAPGMVPGMILGMASVAGDGNPLVDRLSNRLGPARVLRLVAADSHCPERAEQRRPALAVERLSGQAGRTAGQITRATATRATPLRATTARRPPFLLSRPELIVVTAELPEGPPLRFTWRRLSRRVRRAEGPERIEPEWWRAFLPRDADRHGLPWDHADGNRPRDYYAIEDIDGARYWVFRAGLYGDVDVRGLPIWFLHGVFA